MSEVNNIHKSDDEIFAGARAGKDTVPGRADGRPG